MPSKHIRKSAEAESNFVQWLQTIGRKPYNDKSLLAHYMCRNGKDGQWDAIVRRLRTEKAEWWTFLRGQLSEDQVKYASKEYLSRFVFICREEPAKPYIDDLLGIEECQLKLRLGVDASDIVRCPECRAKDIEIRALKQQLQRVGREATADSRLELLRTAYVNNFRYDPDGRLSRTALHDDMEEHLRREIDDNETLPIGGDLWRAFMKDVVKAPINGPLRMARRMNSLVDALNQPDLSAEAAFEQHSRKRRRAIEGAGDSAPSFARDRQRHGSRH